MEYVFVYSTFPTQEDAFAVAKRVIDKRLAACANVFPAGRSFYEWKGSVQDVAETIMILKTTEKQWPALKSAILEGHPYEVPCVASISMAEGNKGFLQWLEDQVG